VYELKDNRVKAALIPAVILSLQLLAANSSLLCGQTTNLHTTFAPPSRSPVLKLYTTSTNEAGPAQGYLSQLNRPQAPETGYTATVTNEIGGEINHLDSTGEYVERYVRVPEGNSGKAKLIRFLIPVYREKGTHRKASAGTEDKQ
jgi:hypothetical protein